MFAAAIAGVVGVVLVYELFLKPKAPAGIGAPAGPGNLMTVQGRSGNTWGVVNVPNQPVAPGVSVWNVFGVAMGPSGAGMLPGGVVITYAQQGSDMSSRAFIGSPRPPSDPLVAAARADFGV